MPTIISSCVENKQYFKTMLKWNLGSLQILRGINLQYTPLEPFWSNKTYRGLIICEAGHPEPVVRQLLAEMRRDVLRYLERLARVVSQDPQQTSTA
jgi:hypothetical protein